MPDELSPKDRIVRHFLRTAYNGEQLNVLSEVQALCDVDEGTASKLLLEAYEEKGTLVTLNVAGGGPTKAVMCTAAKVGDAYLHPSSSTLFTVDPRTLACTTVGKHEANRPPVASVLEAALQSYADQYYKDAVATVYSERAEGGTSLYHVVLTAASASDSNMWSGAWSSAWEVEEDETCFFVTGKLDVSAHYYEGGNVGLTGEHSTKSGEEQKAIVCRDPQEIVEAIKKKEDEYHQQLENWYQQMDQTFRSMRRVLPMWKERFDWNPGKYALSKQLISQNPK
jgi:hypothetical protein